ncbi:hypothetical protein QGN29_05610 [Temperatibacter marinus]|uniref:Arylesterase n=1 Tax=Temperatibacter marinus TaxID=1456591 RepID=A0AA52HAQ6_9PROT|nr:hypothetical protein [Temperatibacter marinus]WND03847.1 hypothetical protein QGN29_05610 [Temperatibacter marinus]
MLKFSIRLGLFLCLLIILRLAYVVGSGTGLTQSYEPKLADQCTPILIAPGTEDITIDHELGQVFVSADNRRKNGDRSKNGIYMFTAGDPSTLKKISMNAPRGFRPHGFSLWKGPKGNRRLFVVSHPARHTHAIEVFTVKTNGMLDHIKTITDPLIHSPNDLVAVGEDTFYVTNDHGWTGAMRMVEDFLAVPVSNVVFYQSGTSEVVINGLSYANGITASEDAQTLYISEISKRQIRAWHKSDTHGFEEGKTWPMRMAADNLEWDDFGRLWTAGHPNTLAFLNHAKDPKNLSPSMASFINLKSDTITEGLYSSGSEMSGSSVATASKGRLYLGAVFEAHILSCPLLPEE